MAAGAGACPQQSGLPLPCPSGVVPEDQAPYVCEAQNVFGKVQAETRLVVTGHGLLGDLEGQGKWEVGTPRRAPPRPPILWDRCVQGQVFLEGHLQACFLGGPLGRGWESLCPHPQESRATNTVSSPHSRPPDRQQRLHRPGAGEAARVPALHHPGRKALPREALAQGRSAGECQAPPGAAGGAAGRQRGVSHLYLGSTLLCPCFGISSSFLPLFPASFENLL